MVSAFSTVADSQHWHRNDNFTCTVRYSDGSVCSLTYTSMGNSGHPKEQSEIFVDGKVLFLNDYKSLSVTGAKGGWSGKTIAKGQFEELQALAAALRGTTDWPITLQEQLDTAELAIAIEELIAQ